ncbi:MAG: M2 family metallopeptidase [Ignavibacteria bacterium]|nr:M2 family metallopeptidase [Ignavibacteria bacterium]
MKKHKFSLIIIPLLLIGLMAGLVSLNCGSEKEKGDKNMETELSALIKDIESKIAPLQKEANLSYWDAAISGKEEDFTKVADLQFKLNAIYSDPETYKKLETFKNSDGIKDELLKRQLDVLYLDFKGYQVDTILLNAVTKLSTEIEQKYGNFRAEVDGKQYTDNEIEDILVNSTDNKELENIWKAHKKIGSLVSEDVIKLVKMRNEIAKKLGYNNYHEMSLKLSEQDPADISKLFDELDTQVKDGFAKEKDEVVDEFLAKRYKIKKEELMPWHYQNRFFQEAPKVYTVDLDIYYKDQNLEKLTADYYSSIGIPVDEIIKKSDLYEKEGKNQHAFCTDIDNEGDVRVLCNIKPNEKWMNTMLHEYGHGVYDKYMDLKMPFFLREPAHTFTTEAIAMLFGRLSANANWMKDMKIVNEEDAKKILEPAFKSLRLQQLVFSRWSQVMFRFEKAMYENPDQDLNKVWWDLVEKYQLIKKPADRNEPDWASKIHIALYPCYYHNYHLGELFASQLYYYIVKNILKSEDFDSQSFANNKDVGKYLVEKVFNPGAKYYWNDMIEKATGEKLTAKYYGMQFVK